MIAFTDILQYCQAEAISGRVSPTEESMYRSLCRDYSEHFNTPLHMVLELNPEFVILNVLEKRAEKFDLEDYQSLEGILDMIMSI